MGNIYPFQSPPLRLCSSLVNFEYVPHILRLLWVGPEFVVETRRECGDVVVLAVLIE